MVKHMAFLRFKDGVSAEQIDEHFAACRGLAARIPAAVGVQCGVNFGERAAGFTHCILVTVRDRDDLAAYLGDPAHVAVAQALGADAAEVIVMDADV